ncbi:PAX-interacting protein 1-like [Drosophila takahashii]|uniref:PAX-interacting protein 1-like n=1 Tax=Drosophila takahashii TaxID=29030 RepID=UPI0038995D0A
MDRGESCPLQCTNKKKQRAENSLLALFGFSSEQDDLFRTRNLRSDDNLSLALSSWLRYTLNDMSMRQTYVPTGMAQYQQQQLLQKHQQLQRHQTMSLPQEHPLMAQQQQQLQRQQLLQQQLQQQQRQQQQYYFAQLQPQIGAVYNPRSWLPYHSQQPSNPQGNYQYWYGRPQPVNIPKAAPLHPELIPPSFCQHTNGAYNQPTAASKPESKPAEKARSSAPKDQAQPTISQGRPMAGGRSNFRPQSSTASDSLNRINSLTSFQDESGSQIRDSEEDMIKYRRIAARTLSPEMDEFNRRQKSLKLQKDKQLQEQKINTHRNFPVKSP